MQRICRHILCVIQHLRIQTLGLSPNIRIARQSPHPNESHVTLDVAAPKADISFQSQVTGTLYVPKLRTEGKRFTRKPAKFCSPFKHGILSRPPPNMDAAMNLHSFLCADNSILRKLVQMPLSIVSNS